MTDREREGLRIAQQLLHREIEAGNEPQEALEAASRWLERQFDIDTRRRRPRGTYRPRRRQ